MFPLPLHSWIPLIPLILLNLLGWGISQQRLRTTLNNASTNKFWLQNFKTKIEPENMGPQGFLFQGIETSRCHIASLMNSLSCNFSTQDSQCPAPCNQGSVSRYAVPLYKPLMGDRSQTGCQVREMWHEMPRRVDLVVTTVSFKHAM